MAPCLDGHSLGANNKGHTNVTVRRRQEAGMAMGLVGELLANEKRMLFGLFLQCSFHSVCIMQVLEVFPYPMNITTLPFALGTVVVFILWITGILSRPKVSGAQLSAILPMAMVHAMVSLFTNISLGKVIAGSLEDSMNKAPIQLIFSVLLASILVFLGQMKDFNYLQLRTAWFVLHRLRTVTFHLRNVPSKKPMVKQEERPLDSIDLFSVISIISFVLLASTTFLIEGFKFTPGVLQSRGLSFAYYPASVSIALPFYTYQQGIYTVLDMARISVEQTYNKLAQATVDKTRLTQF